MKIWIVGNQTSQVTFDYKELSKEETAFLINLLKATRTFYKSLKFVYGYSITNSLLKKLGK